MLTLRHAAARTGLSATTLRRYIKSGRLPARLIPGRYGPEYVVDDDDLRQAELLGEGPDDALPEDDDVLETPDRPTTALATRAGLDAAPAHHDAMADYVPGLLFRELTMKHEQLLVQFGMLRVSGQQLYEARRTATELALVRDRHAREIGELKARLRQAELEIAARQDEVVHLRSEMRRLEIISRNAATLIAMDEQFAQRVQRSPLPEPRLHAHSADDDH